MACLVLSGIVVLLLDGFQHLADIRRRCRLDGLLVMLNQLGNDAIDSHAAIAYCRQHVLVIVDIEPQAGRIQPFIPQQVLRLIAKPFSFLLQKLPAPDDIFLTLHLLEPGADFGTGIR